MTLPAGTPANSMGSEALDSTGSTMLQQRQSGVDPARRKSANVDSSSDIYRTSSPGSMSTGTTHSHSSLAPALAIFATPPDCRFTLNHWPASSQKQTPSAVL
ncbi:hypothetical protein J8273_3760 [Carpediemonas membranifera]|uniref:Uncharacterized protein n=1 Tax=Carpediemonas membranifera TaxID=201153 RepID=A0A8J6AUW8_9EUKA|nr:hypothetical protein J8273_3760 [Carpediemonas membranifera]|eukprot:KAG9394783.1 hypothetical protein J8273_3760 [Carpediemonas membranifera]